jgi:chromosome segregation ATPase
MIRIVRTATLRSERATAEDQRRRAEAAQRDVQDRDEEITRLRAQVERMQGGIDYWVRQQKTAREEAERLKATRDALAEDTGAKLFSLKAPPQDSGAEQPSKDGLSRAAAWVVRQAMAELPDPQVRESKVSEILAAHAVLNRALRDGDDALVRYADADLLAALRDSTPAERLEATARLVGCEPGSVRRP